MTLRLNPYLQFGTDAREAMTFYADVLGGHLEIMPFSTFGDPSAPEADLVMHAMLQTPGGLTLMASDSPPGMDVAPGSAHSVSLSGDEAEVLRGCWERLTEGATITMPLEKQMWGDEFGSLVDRFGVQWMVNIAAPPA